MFRELRKEVLDVRRVSVSAKRQSSAAQRELLPGAAPHWRDLHNHAEN